jgi:hypothetical protein
MLLQAAQPIIVRVVETTPVPGTSMAQLILTALGVVGLSLLAAAVLGGLLGAVLIGVKRVRERYDLGSNADSVPHIVEWGHSNGTVKPYIGEV